MATRISMLIVLLAMSWCVMTFTHEIGHIIGGWCCGAQLIDFDLRPWHLPYSFFKPDPNPLITLWAGPILGAVVPVLFASVVRRDWSWFIAYFCVLANGAYIAVGWASTDSQLDTTKLLSKGADRFSLLLYCVVTIVVGYVGFRRQCVRLICPDNATNDQASGSGSTAAS